MSVLAAPRSLALRRLLPAWTRAEKPLFAHLPWLVAAGPAAILTRDGDLMGCLRLKGIPAGLGDPGLVTRLRDGFAGVLEIAGPAVGVYVHHVVAPAAPALPPVLSPPFAAAVDAAWAAHLNRANLQDRSLWLSLLVRSGLPLVAGSETARRADRARRLKLLDELLGFLGNALGPAGPERMTLSGGDWLGFLGQVAGGLPQRVAPPLPGQPIAACLPTRRITFRGDGFTLAGEGAGDGAGMEIEHGAVFSLKSYGPASWPGMFDALVLPGTLLATQSFTPISRLTALERIRRIARQMQASNDAAVSLCDDLTRAADDLESARLSFGTHHLSATLLAPDRDTLAEAAARLRQAALETGAVLVRESLAARAVWLAQAPGNFAHRARSALLSSRNFADMTAFHGVAPGRGPEATPLGTVLALMPTTSGTPYRFNLHEAGSPAAEPSRGHTLILGASNAGKSTFAGFLMAQSQRAGLRIIAFDKDQGLEMAIRALGGSYTKLEAGQPSGLNPFTANGEASGEAWLTDWLGHLLTRERPLSPEQAQALVEAVRENSRHPDLQSMPAFAARFGGLDDGGDLAARLADWAPGGRHAWVFATPGPDRLSLAPHITGLDMTGLLDLALPRQAVLATIFRRVERLVGDGTPTLILIDEAWRLLDDAWFAARLKDWMLTLRKKHTSLVFLTQLLSHIEASAAGRSILENLATLLIFPNPAAPAADYARLGLPPAAAALATRSPGGQRLLLVASGGDLVTLDAGLGGLGPHLVTLGGGQAGARAHGADWRECPEFWRTPA